LIKVFGADHLIMGTDYPYDMGEFDPIGHVRSVEQLSDATVAAIAGGNARRVLGI
jgi:aminocarboxymuconate-semialdehyde decarboxylase